MTIKTNHHLSKQFQQKLNIITFIRGAITFLFDPGGRNKLATDIFSSTTINESMQWDTCNTDREINAAVLLNEQES